MFDSQINVLGGQNVAHGPVIAQAWSIWIIWLQTAHNEASLYILLLLQSCMSRVKAKCGRTKRHRRWLDTSPPSIIFVKSEKLGYNWVSLTLFILSWKNVRQLQNGKEKKPLFTFWSRAIWTLFGLDQNYQDSLKYLTQFKCLFSV